MKKIYTLLVVLFMINSAIGQSCLPQGITFNFQNQVDSFAINYPNCSMVEGDVFIGEGNINNLSGLSVLTAIGGNLWIHSVHGITNLSGLDNIVSVGGYLSLSSNTGLTSLTGLNNLSSVGGDLLIEAHWYLASLEPLGNLSQVGGYLYLNDNDLLTNLHGLENITTVGGDLNIITHEKLTSLSGIQNITTVGGNLFIAGAPLLTSLAELSNINTINGELKIQSLSLLTNLSGLDNINPATIHNLTIRYNHVLSMCAVQSICAYLADPGGEVDIAANITGCNSEEEVIDVCESIGIDAPDPPSSLAIYPNPASGSIQVETPVNGILVISDLSGQKLLSKEINKPVAKVDITILPAGVYVVKVVGEKYVMVGKVVKQ